MAVVRPDTTFVAVSAELTALLGYDEQELIGTKSRDLVVENSEDGLVDAWIEKLELAGELSAKCTWIGKDGIRIPYRFVARKLRGKDALFIAHGWPEGPGRVFFSGPAPGPLFRFDAPEFISVAEAAVLANVDYRTIMKAGRVRKQFEVFGVARRYRVRLAEFQAWIDRGMP